MDYVTRQFIVLTKKFRKELPKLFSRLNSALNKQTEAIRENTKRQNVSPAPVPNILSVVNLPESIEIHQRADEARQHRGYQNRTLILSLITFLTLAVYAFLVYLQYREMINATGAAQQAVQESRFQRQQSEKALQATIDQFRLDQRAWIVLRECYILPAAAGEIRITLNVVNTGKSPAKDIQQATSFYVAPTPVLKSPPDNPLLKFRPSAPIAPGGKTELHIAVKVVDLGSDYAAITKGDKIIYEFGEVRYRDVFGNPHRTTFCLYQAAPTDQLFSTCERGNSID